jgi:protein-S-isoprenylcysteine O-methyltransferase Ste14
MSRPNTAGVIAPPPLIYLGGLAAGFALDAALPSPELPGAVAVPLGGALVATGVALAGSFAAAFRRAGTPVDPYRTTTSIVTTGPYKLTRNPAYVGMASAYVGIALLARKPWALATLVPTVALIDRGVIAREERYLTRRFGDEYRAYTTRVRRWL